jgi:predicted lipoprotein with Yx(FWY)xxD motif
MGSAPSQPRIRPIATLVGLGLGLILVLAACSSAGGASTAPSAASSPAASTAANPTAPSSGGGKYGGGSGDDYGTPSAAASPGAGGGSGTVDVLAASGTVGPYLTGANGATLYTFKPDTASTSTCVDACAAAWPPFTVAAGGSAKAGTGVSGALTTFARPDGSMQVAYNGRPVYYFSGDTAAGQTNGQGKAGNWFVAAP